MNKAPCPQGGALKPKFLNPKPRSRNKFGMTKNTRIEPYCHAELVSASDLFFLFSEDASFIPVYRTGI